MPDFSPTLSIELLEVLRALTRLSENGAYCQRHPAVSIERHRESPGFLNIKFIMTMHTSIILSLLTASHCGFAAPRIGIIFQFSWKRTKGDDALTIINISPRQPIPTGMYPMAASPIVRGEYSTIRPEYKEKARQ